MKNKLKIIVSFLMALLIGFNASFCAYASDHGGGGTTDTKRDLLKAQESVENRERVESFIKEHFTDAWGFFVYAASQIGCVVTGQYKDAYDSWLTMEDILNSDIGIYVDQNNKADGLYISADLMTQIKNLIDDYAKENEPYWIVPVASYRDIDPAAYKIKAQYSTICQLARTYGLIGVNGNEISDLSNVAKYNHSLVMLNSSVDEPDWSNSSAMVCFYNQDWQWKGYYIYRFNFTSDMTVGFTSFDEGTKLTEATSRVTLHDRFFPNYPFYHNGRLYDYNSNIYEAPKGCLVSKDGGRMRVYKSLDDFKRYTVGKRNVYYTENYYNYVPEDLTTSIDDLQKSVDDLQKVIDDLLGQITDTTDENEIEDLLKQILDELKNNQGSGGGGGGGGDVNVDIDLSTTNTLLSKILAKVTQIFDRMSETAEGAVDTAHAKIQETLDEMLVQVKKLKHWTMADTAVNAADAVADWLDFIKGIFDDAENGAGNAVSALSATMGDAANLMKTKFPFCIPWDVYLIIGFLAEEPQTPVFRLPIKLERLGIDEYMEVNLEDFEIVSSISRTILTLAYCYGLLNLTMKVFPIAKEGD